MKICDILEKGQLFYSKCKTMGLGQSLFNIPIIVIFAPDNTAIILCKQINITCEMVQPVTPS